jgi:hypothetical protein
MRSLRLGVSGCALGAAVLALGACGGSSAGSTATGPSSAGPTPSATASSSASATAKPPATAAVSTVKGRAHDAGTIVGSKTAGGLTVLVLDRWSVKGLSDTKLAANGVPVTPHNGAKFYDQNKGKTYTVPVNPGAPIVVNSCTFTKGTNGASDTSTLTSTPVTLATFLAGSHRSTTVVLLTYDTSGRLVRLDTAPSC